MTTVSRASGEQGTPVPAPQKTMLAYAKDLPNICSLVGLLCAVLAIYYAVRGVFPAAMIGMIWAVFFDWSDGVIARRMKRTEEQRLFGGQLDSLIDIVSFGICPAVVLLSYGHFSLWFIPGAFIVVAIGAIRLSYFNVFGLVRESTYMGLALDNNVIILVFVFLFSGLVGSGRLCCCPLCPAHCVGRFERSSYQDSQICRAMVLRSYRLYFDNVCDIWVAVTCKLDDWLVVVTGYQCGIVVGRWSGEDCRLAHRGKGRGFR